MKTKNVYVVGYGRGILELTPTGFADWVANDVFKSDIQVFLDKDAAGKASKAIENRVGNVNEFATVIGAMCDKEFLTRMTNDLSTVESMLTEYGETGGLDMMNRVGAWESVAAIETLIFNLEVAKGERTAEEASPDEDNAEARREQQAEDYHMGYRGEE